MQLYSIFSWFLAFSDKGICLKIRVTYMWKMKMCCDENERKQILSLKSSPIYLGFYCAFFNVLCVLHHSVCPTLQPYGLLPARLLCPWEFPGKSIGVSCHCFLQGSFPTQGQKLYLLCLLHQQVDSSPLELPVVSLFKLCIPLFFYKSSQQLKGS